jgi:hypothetical protein
MAAKGQTATAVAGQEDGLVALGRGLLEGSGPAAVVPAVEPGLEVPTLRLDELISDEHGEVVLFNDSGLRAIALETDAGIVARGAAEPHVTAGGDDVSGLRYVTFANGLTLYYQDGLELLVRSEHG